MPFGPNVLVYCPCMGIQARVLIHAVSVLSQRTRRTDLTRRKTRGCNPLSGEGDTIARLPWSSCAKREVASTVSHYTRLLRMLSTAVMTSSA